jgi:hypothetical protein
MNRCLAEAIPRLPADPDAGIRQSSHPNQNEIKAGWNSRVFEQSF